MPQDLIEDGRGEVVIADVWQLVEKLVQNFHLLFVTKLDQLDTQNSQERSDT
jgi:hypothetical protein